jgi:hypothetical protein
MCRAAALEWHNDKRHEVQPCGVEVMAEASGRHMVRLGGTLGKQNKVWSELRAYASGSHSNHHLPQVSLPVTLHPPYGLDAALRFSFSCIDPLPVARAAQS